MKRLFPVVMLIMCGLISACDENKQEKSVNQPHCLINVAVSSTIPQDTKLSDQASFNCMAWQQFIALNWSADLNADAKTFGTPGDYTPKVFETYMNIHSFLGGDGSDPGPWRNQTTSTVVNGEKVAHPRYLSRTSKFSDGFDSGDIEEAAPSPNAWLADKQGNLVWYEVLVNQDEYDYFYRNGFYNAKKQNEAASQGIHINLPKGELGGRVGAMEIKTAWLTVEEPDDPKWQRYKLANGVFCDDTEHCSSNTVALIGMHIIHKTVSQPSWIWSTFEHVDNAPDKADINSGKVLKRDYNFYSESCTEQAIPSACIKGTASQDKAVTTTCEPNTAPKFGLNIEAGKPVGQCLPYPIQVVREYPIPNTNENPVKDINDMAHALIRQENPDSVYQNYQLVNVIWNDSTVDENKAKALPVDSLSLTGFRPNPATFPVANTVLETYVQQTSCVECHAHAHIATLSTSKTSNTTPSEFASDYSFLFKLAKSKESQTQQVSPDE